MVETPQPSGSVIIAVIAAASSSLGAIKLWQTIRRQQNKEIEEHSVGLEEIRTRGFLTLLEDYRQQVLALRAEILSQGLRHASAMKEAADRFDALESEHIKALSELAAVKAELAALTKRIDGE